MLLKKWLGQFFQIYNILASFAGFCILVAEMQLSVLLCSCNVKTWCPDCLSLVFGVSVLGCPFLVRRVRHLLGGPSVGSDPSGHLFLRGEVLCLFLAGPHFLPHEVPHRVRLWLVLGAGPRSSVGLGGRSVWLPAFPRILGCLGVSACLVGNVVLFPSPVPLSGSPQEEVAEIFGVLRQCLPAWLCGRHAVSSRCEGSTLSLRVLIFGRCWGPPAVKPWLVCGVDLQLSGLLVPSTRVVLVLDPRVDHSLPGPLVLTTRVALVLVQTSCVALVLALV